METVWICVFMLSPSLLKHCEPQPSNYNLSSTHNINQPCHVDLSGSRRCNKILNIVYTSIVDYLRCRLCLVSFCIFVEEPFSKKLYRKCHSQFTLLGEQWLCGWFSMVINKFMNTLCRFVGPYLRICPEHVFVVEDGDGICGYAVAAPDSKHFYEQFKKHWLPEVCTNIFSCYLTVVVYIHILS